MKVKKLRTLAVFGIAVTMAAGVGAMPAWADDPPALSHPPGPGDPTTMMVPFSVPVPFATAVTQAASYPGTVLAIRYDNPELTGEYSFGSGVTPAAFEADFLTQYGTTPAATALVVETTVPEEPSAAQSFTSRATERQSIDVGSDAFVPVPATFTEEMQALFVPPVDDDADGNSARSMLAGVTDWRASEVGVQITNYTPGQIDIVMSYWWLGPNAPSKVPEGFGVEFEVQMYNNVGTTGQQPDCYFEAPYIRDSNYRSRFAAQTQNWNWRVVRPDGVTAPSSLGAYADYNSWLDECNRGSFGIGLRYPQGIQYVNGAYGILFVISAPKGLATTSTISANSQAVSEGFCLPPWPGMFMSLTDCMGATAGYWPPGSGPKSQNVLGEYRGWTAPRRCWGTNYQSEELGEVEDYTSWMCP